MQKLYEHTMKYDFPILTHAVTQMNINNIAVIEISQLEKKDIYLHLHVVFRVVQLMATESRMVVAID